MRFSTVFEWLAWINQIHFTEMDLGLDRVKKVAQVLDVLSFDCPVIIVGGTNGKGSTVAGLEAIYQAAGYRTGVFTSPYLFTYNEQIRVNGCAVENDSSIINAFEKIDSARGETTLTPFEFTTLAALLIFKLQRLSDGLDVLILEVGLGGRLDAVNVIDADVAVVTSIGIDHVEWLGDTREKIGFEKAGIFRGGKFAVCGDQEPPVSLIEYAEEVQARLYCQGRDFKYEETDDGWLFCSKGSWSKLSRLSRLSRLSNWRNWSSDFKRFINFFMGPRRFGYPTVLAGCARWEPSLSLRPIKKFINRLKSLRSVKAAGKNLKSLSFVKVMEKYLKSSSLRGARRATKQSMQRSFSSYGHLPVNTLAVQNMSTVLMTITLLQDRLTVSEIAIRQGLLDVNLPGRLQVVPGDITYIYDVSHNPDAVKWLFQKLRELPCKGKTRAIFSMLADKDIRACLDMIKNKIEEWHVAPLMVKRAASLMQLKEVFQQADIKHVIFYDVIKTAHEAARQEAVSGDRIVVFGSFHTLSQVLGNKV